jgi:integrase
MASRVRYLIVRNDRYYARIVVPKDLRAAVGKTELATLLGADRKTALRRLPAAVAAIQDHLDAARKGVSARRQDTGRRRLLDADEMARIHYAQATVFDSELRDTDARYASIGFIDEKRVATLKGIIAGSSTDDKISSQLGSLIEYFRVRGNHNHVLGSPEWRALARKLAYAELESLRAQAARDDGDPAPETPEELRFREADVNQLSARRIPEIFEAYRLELQKAGKGRNASRKWAPIITNLTKFLGHDRAARVTRADAIKWKDHLLTNFSPKTARDHYLAMVRSAFTWAVNNGDVASNPFSGIKLIVPRARLARERGYTDVEAVAVLQAALAYKSATAKEAPETAAAKRWTPLLAAYTGARIVELTQLRAEDVQIRDNVPFVRITPDAGSVKSGMYRDVPLHSHLVELGFMRFAKAKKSGPLFYRAGERTGDGQPAQIVADRVGKWVRSLRVSESSVAPSHGWRHRFKSVAREIGIDAYVADAIQGHAPRTAGEGYGDVSLRVKKNAIDRIPRYPIKLAGD